MTQMHITVHAGEQPESAATTLRTLIQAGVASRILQRDASLWGPAAAAEARIRLGWVDPFREARDIIARASAVRSDLTRRGITRVVLCGMGGSSLGPEVIARWAGVPLVLLDTTHPASVRNELSQDLARTAVVVSSKSGTTVETRSQLAAFEAAYAQAGLPAAHHIIVVTDPGSELAKHAQAAGYCVFHADPEIGGRFSVFSAFGLVPATLAGADTERLIHEAEVVHASLFADVPDNVALQLAAHIAAGLPDAWVLGVAEQTSTPWRLGDWIEQLLAESTGKDGKGILPIALSGRAPEPAGSRTRHSRVIWLRDQAPTRPVSPGSIVVAAPLGAQFLLWEVATALLGFVLNIDPFNQPDVESAKVAARAALVAASDGNAPHADQAALSPRAALTELRQTVSNDGYVAIQAFIQRTPHSETIIEALRSDLARMLGIPVAAGFGPRYLHSTGQFHKGGPRVGSFLQILDRELPELPIPESGGSTFGELLRAQAAGDRKVLLAQGRPVITLYCADFAEAVAEMRVALSQ